MQLLWGVKTARGYALLIGAGSMFKLILRIYRCRCPLFFLSHDVPVVAGLSHGAKFTADVALVVVICGTCWVCLCGYFVERNIRLELISTDWKSAAQPIYQSRLANRQGLEPRTRVLETPILPIKLSTHYFILLL